MAKPKKAKAPAFNITVKLGTNTLTGSGDTVLAALQAVPPPVKITTKVILTLTDGVKSCEKLYNIPRAKRLFYPMAQYLWAKQLSQSLK